MCRAVDCFSNLVKALTKYERPKMKRDMHAKNTVIFTEKDSIFGRQLFSFSAVHILLGLYKLSISLSVLFSETTNNFGGALESGTPSTPTIYSTDIKEGCNRGHGLSAAIKLGFPETKLLQCGRKLTCSQ